MRRSYIDCLFILCLFLRAGFQLQAAGISESASGDLRAFVMENVKSNTVPVIAILAFNHEDGSQSMEGHLISERLLTDLAGESAIRIVERKYLESALAEQKLSLEGYISPETAARAGRLTGAQWVLAGTVAEMGEILEINARLFSVESAEVIAAKTIQAKKSIKTFINPLWDDIEAIKTRGERFGAKIWTRAERIPIGEPAEIYFRVEESCFVTIFDYSTDGSITVLFPNRFQPNNRVRRGVEYKIPAEAAGYRIRVRGPAGIERLKLFAVSEDIPLYVRDYSQSPFSTIDDGDAIVLRGLQATFEEMPASGWGECSWEFLIENPYR